MTPDLIASIILGVAVFAFLAWLSRSVKSVSDSIDDEEPPNLRDAKACVCCKHCDHTDWNGGAYCKKFDSWSHEADVCDAFEHE